jgi:nitrous oxidase accessory protein NosD
MGYYINPWIILLRLIILSSRIFFDNCNNNSFTNNDVVDNDLALQLMGNGESNRIIHNNFINNLGNLVLDGKHTDTEWTGDEGGNHWSDYKGYDLDGDGLGDVPHIIQNVFQVLEAKTPEIRFYLNSPAAEILALAEEALPILELGLVKDLIPVFKPFENKSIPWERTDQLNFATSPALAILFLLGGIIPFSFLLYLSRKHRK